jgi:hypothetical protein
MSHRSRPLRPLVPALLGRATAPALLGRPTSARAPTSRWWARWRWASSTSMTTTYGASRPSTPCALGVVPGGEALPVGPSLLKGREGGLEGDE